MGDDLYSLLMGGDEPDPKAMAAALRQQQGLGLLAQMYGTKSLAGLGQGLTENANQQQQMLMQAAERAPALALSRAQLAEQQRRQTALADPSSVTSQLRTSLVRQFGGQLPADAPGNAVDDKEMELLERAQAAKEGRALRRSLSGQGGGADGWDSATIDAMARAVNAGDDKVLAGLGRSNATLGVRKRVIQRAVELAGEGGQTPDLAGGRAAFQADKKSLDHLQTQADAVNSFTRTFDKNVGILEQALATLSSSNSPVINKGLRWAQANLQGDPNYTAFANALNTVRSELGKINSGSTGAGGVPVSVLQEMEHTLPENATPAQVVAALKVYRRDSENRRKALEEQLGEIRGRMKGGKAATTEAGGPHPQTDAALQWAKANPDDPRATKILQRLGAK